MLFQGEQSFVGVNDYANIQGFGVASPEEVADLNKALSVGYANPPTTGGDVLRVESLEKTLKVVTFEMKHLKIWPKVTKAPAYSTVEEYNRLNAYGNVDAGGFFAAGGLPETQDTNYSRETALVKYLGTTREVQHPATLIKPANGDVISLETKNGTMWLLNKMERSMFYGNATNNALEFDGLEQLVPAANVIDLQGNSLTEGDIERAVNVAAENYGVPSDLFLGLKNMSDLVRTFYPKERYNLPAPSGSTVGLNVTSFMSQIGPIQFNPDVFITPGGVSSQIGAPPSAATSPNAPAAPTVGALTVNAVTTGSLTAGDYAYQVTAVNASGESAPTVITANSTAAANNTIDVPITKGAGADPLYYRIYRRDNDDASGALFVTNVKFSASPQTWVDTGATIAGTRTAFLLPMSPDIYRVKQLAPLMKMPLAVVSASYRWMQLLYAVPIAYQPTKLVMFKNIGEL